MLVACLKSSLVLYFFAKVPHGMFNPRSIRRLKSFRTCILCQGGRAEYQCRTRLSAEVTCQVFKQQTRVLFEDGVLAEIRWYREIHADGGDARIRNLMRQLSRTAHKQAANSVVPLEGSNDTGFDFGHVQDRRSWRCGTTANRTYRT